MQTIKFKITGESPLVMHADTLANPLNLMTKEMKKITSKRIKTDDDREEMAAIEWMAALHYDKSIGPFIPAQNIDACITGAAKLRKRGKDIARGMMTLDNHIPLEYDGPRDPQKMFANGLGDFVDVRSVVVQRARCIRCRPIFKEWSLSFSIGFNPEIFNQQEVVDLLTTAGQLMGLCEMRPRYGKFSVKKI